MHITLHNISMGYPGHAPILRDISFGIPQGTRVALIGKSGAGKSTLASLVRRDTDPTGGDVLIDGVPLRRYSLSSVLAHVGVILQSTEVVSGTIRENILLSVPLTHLDAISDDDVWDVVNLVSPEMKSRFNGAGLDTKVGHRGLRLSGGERQRLSIMRALIKNPLFLVVDEATSSLDSETEVAVQHGIDTALSRGMSALVIAHRFSTIQNCNQFVVLKKLSECEEGEPQIEATAGSLQELYESSPTFRTLADTQGFKVS